MPLGDAIMMKFIVSALLFLSIEKVAAGQVEGPYILWVNLSENPHRIDNKIKAFVNTQDNMCWNSDALLFMRNKPSGLSEKLVRSAILKKDSRAIYTLKRLIKKPFNEASDGFDGIIVYDDSKGEFMYSLTTGHHKPKVEKINDPEDLELSFCLVLPKIVRRP